MAKKKRRRRKVRWTRLLLPCVLILVIPLLLTGCIKGISYLIHKDDGFIKEEFATSSDGYLEIIKEGYESEVGVDVSSFQGDINWYSVKEAGIDFAIIRVGFRDGNTGVLYEDPLAYKNLENAKNAGLKVGMYFYSSAINEEELKEEVDFVLQMANEYKVDYPIAYDMEPMLDGSGRINDLTREQKTKMAIRFCDFIEDAGYTPMVYGNQDWLENQILFNDVKKYGIWYAGYVEQPTLDFKFAMWQYSGTGKVNGIAGNVDMNILIRKK